MIKLFIAAIICFKCTSPIFSQSSKQGFLTPSAEFNKGRLTTVIITESLIAGAITAGLHLIWYKKFPRSRFHLVNDNKGWLSMDKASHATTAYNISAFQYDMLRWSGVKERSSAWISGITGLGYMTIIEILDGLSAKWGFSPGDMFANIAGSTLFVSQQLCWQQQRIQLRFSFHPSIYAKYNPEQLGKNILQRFMKDYNGETYWLSFNISSFLKSNSSFPKWINADIGYSAEGMISEVSNPAEIEGKPIPVFTRTRKLVFGAGAAFSNKGQIPYSSWLNTLRLPSPVLEWKLVPGKITFKPLYF